MGSDVRELVAQLQKTSVGGTCGAPGCHCERARASACGAAALILEWAGDRMIQLENHRDCDCNCLADAADTLHEAAAAARGDGKP